MMIPGKSLSEQVNSVHLLWVTRIQHYQAVKVSITYVTCNGTWGPHIQYVFLWLLEILVAVLIYFHQGEQHEWPWWKTNQAY